MSVYELLSLGERPNGLFDYVDENGDVQAGSMGDDALERPVESPTVDTRRLGETALPRVASGLDRHSKNDAILQEIEDYADKRGIPIYDASLALHGVSIDDLMGKSGTVSQSIEQKQEIKPTTRRRRRGEPVSGEHAQYMIGAAQASAEEALNRRLTDEEMTTIASDVMRELRFGSQR